MMLTQELVSPSVGTVAAPQELTAVSSLMLVEEAPVSDAPLYTPEDAGVGILLLGLLLSPKPPKER